MLLRIPLKNLPKTPFIGSLNSNPALSWGLSAANPDVIFPGQLHYRAILNRRICRAAAGSRWANCF
jgi:hypothetical protein